MSKNKLFPTLLAVAVILMLWQLLSMAIAYPAIFPGLVDLFLGIIQLLSTTEFYSTLATTILRGMVGFSISFVLAFLLALFAYYNKFFKSFFQPFLVLIRSIPVISLVLIALLWFSSDNLPVFIALLTMFPILYQNILSGFEHVDYKLIEMATVFGKSPLVRLFEIYLPASKNLILAGISTGLGFGWRAVIIGEVLAQPLKGIGSEMKHAQAFINLPELIAWTFIAVGVSYFFELIVKKISHTNTISASIFFKSGKKLVSHRKWDSIKNIQLQNINLQFGENQIFKSLNINFSSLEINCIKAPSGRGKTTLLRIIASSEKISGGMVVKDKNYRIAYSFQDVRLLPWLTVEQNIAFAFDNNHILSVEQSEIISLMLEKLQLSAQKNSLPAELSGGQQQRVGLARALAAQSDILLLDEPLNGLDNELKQTIISWIEHWTNNYKPLIIWATHEKIQPQNSVVNEIILN